MMRRKSILWIVAHALGILLMTEGILGVSAVAFAADKDLTGETVTRTDTEEIGISSETAGDDAGVLGKSGDDDDYVVGANTVIDKIGMEGYDGVTDDSMELYTAFYADLNLEIQGGRYFKGHEILNFADSDIKVYDKENYQALSDGNESTNAEPKAKPSDFNGSMVFALDEIPVEMSDNYMLFYVDYNYSSNSDGDVVPHLEKVTNAALYAWEYEKQADGSYKRITSVPISREDFAIDDDDNTMYVDLGLGHIDADKRTLAQLSSLDSYTAPKIYSYLSEEEHSGMRKDYYQHVPTLSGLVRIDGSAFKDSSNPIAIAAMCYDATNSEAETLYKTESGTAEGYTWTYHEYSWDNNAGFAATESISYDWYYYGGDDNYTKYWSDEPFYASNMGSFSLRPYVYRFTDTGTEHILTLYHVTPYSLFVRKIEQARHYFDNWKAADYSQANLPIDTWKIPATYTDPLSGTTYKVRIAKGGNIVPQFASKLIIEEGVGFPDDCSYLFSSLGNITLRSLSEIVIQGNPKTVGSNIKNMSYMFLGKQGREGFDATTYASLDFAALDTSNVTDMSFLFADVTMTSRANIDVTTLDTSKVKSFKGMFRSYHVPGIFISSPATALDLSLFHTESAEDMSEMFEGSTFSALDLSNFDFSKVTDMSKMFTFTEYLESVTFPSDMDSTKVIDMSFMFAGDYHLTRINNFTAMDTGSVTDMSGMFGAHQCNKKLIETIPVYMDPDVWSGSYQYDKFLDGFAVFSPAWVTAKLYNVNAGPAITSLDLTGFDTRNVKYANGMFYMPKLTEIKWGESTTFEALSDAGGMFTLASVKKLDLTGRKFSNIKFACSDRFPMEMFNLNQATELVLGEDSINLSKLSSKGQFVINAPMLYSLDFRQVEMGANALAGEGAVYYGSPGSLQGASGLYEIYLPAGMPLLTSPAELPGTFYDEDDEAYTVINGGYENALHLVNPEKKRRPQTITADDVTVTYGDTDKAVNAAVTDPAEGGGEITYAVKEGSENYIDVDTSTGALTVKAVPADGKAYVIVTADETQTCTQAAKEVTVTIAKAKITPIVSMTGWTYGSAANAPSVTGNSGNAAVTYTYAVKGSDAYSTVVPVAAGDYTVKAEIAATANYEGASATANFTISKAETSGDANTGNKPNDPATQNPATQEPKDVGSDVPKEEGTTITDTKSGATFEVTGNKGQTPTVAYKGTDSPKKKVEIPKTVRDGKVTYKVTGISAKAFKGNKTIESVKIPATVTQIGDSAFANCSKLTKITLPAKVSKLGDSAFANCSKLTKITLPAKVSKLGKNLFKGCKKLKTITIKNKKLKAKDIKKGAFNGLGKGVTIKVPKGKQKAYEKLFRKKGLSKKVKVK